MTTTRSWLKGECWPLMKQLLRRNIPVGLIFFGVSFCCFPLQYILEVFQRVPPGVEEVIFYLETHIPIYTSVSMAVFSAMMLVLPLLLTLAQVSWMHSRRAVDFYHSLPVGREALLLANAGAVFFTIAIPAAVDYLIVLAAGGIRWLVREPRYELFLNVPMGGILLDYLGWMVTALAIIAVTLLVATQVGSLFENLIFTAELLCLPMGIWWVCEMICDCYLAGFGTTGALGKVIMASPLTMMAGQYLLWRHARDAVYLYWLVPLWGLLAALLLWAACRLYKNRPSELAETAGAREPLNTLGKLGLVCVGGLALAVLVNEGLLLGQTTTLWQAALVCTALAALVSQLVLGRGFRGMTKALPGLAAVVAVSTVFAFGMSHGGFGYSTYIPGKIESVSLGYRGRYGRLADRAIADRWSVNEKGEYSYDEVRDTTYTTPEGIRLVTDLHRALAQQALETERREIAGTLVFCYDDGTTRYLAQRSSHSLYFSPRPIAPLLALEESRELREQTDPRFTLTLDEVKAVRVTDATGLATTGPITDWEFLERLVEAMRKDAEAFDPAILRDGGARAAAYLSVETLLPQGYWSSARIDKDCWRSFCLPVYDVDTHTLNVLTQEPDAKEMAEQPRKDRAAAVTVEWWGDPADVDEAYWVGTGPQSLEPTRSPGDPLPQVKSSVPHKRTQVTDPDEVREILDRCLGRDCHRTDAEGFIVTIEGTDRTGCSFWLAPEEITDGIRAWYDQLVLPEYRAEIQ